MTDETTSRGIVARVGICALNLLLPGLGLVRLARYRLGAAFIILHLALTLILVGTFALHGELTTNRQVTIWIALHALGFLNRVAAIAFTWPASRLQSRRMGWVWRWHGVLGLWLGWIALAVPVLLVQRAHFRSFHITVPLLPNLRTGDLWVADVYKSDPIQRGDLVLFRSRGKISIARVAALPDDRIALVGASVVIDGRPVAIETIRKLQRQGAFGDEQLFLARERFPGEAKAHDIVISRPVPSVGSPEIKVAQDQYFLVGDNRDFPADSRLARERAPGQVSRDRILGRMLFPYWRGTAGIRPEQK